MKKNKLRPVIVHDKGEKRKGFFHRFVFQMADYKTDTRALIELEDGRLRYYDPFFVQFADRIANDTKKK
ncbi:MAG: hypothetical protein AAF600_07245 [Bacteroidota bacterium]